MHPGQPSPTWRPSGAAQPAVAKSAAKPAAGKWRKAFLLLAGIVALGGATLAWLFLLKHFEEPTFLGLPVTEYRGAGLSANAWAEQDSDLLRGHFPKSRKTFNFQERHQLEA